MTAPARTADRPNRPRSHVGGLHRGPRLPPRSPRPLFAGSALTSEGICCLRLVPARGRVASGHGLVHDVRLRAAADGKATVATFAAACEGEYAAFGAGALALEVVAKQDHQIGVDRDGTCFAGSPVLECAALAHRAVVGSVGTAASHSSPRSVNMITGTGPPSTRDDRLNGLPVHCGSLPATASVRLALGLPA
jgi:hypothetical protein